jgi:hypothetical protein
MDAAQLKENKSIDTIPSKLQKKSLSYGTFDLRIQTNNTCGVGKLAAGVIVSASQHLHAQDPIRDVSFLFPPENSDKAAP